MLDWLAKLLNLPVCFLAFGPDMKLGRGGGIIQASPCVSECPKLHTKYYCHKDAVQMRLSASH